MEMLPITEARRRFLEIADHLDENPDGGVVVVTKRSRPVVALMSYDYYQTLRETLDIAGDSRLMVQLRANVAEVSEGMATPWQRVRSKLRKKR